MAPPGNLAVFNIGVVGKDHPAAADILPGSQPTATAGFGRCRNVADGFEGPLDPNRHRGQLGGWKSKGLPWALG